MSMNVFDIYISYNLRFGRVVWRWHFNLGGCGDWKIGVRVWDRCVGWIKCSASNRVQRSNHFVGVWCLLKGWSIAHITLTPSLTLTQCTHSRTPFVVERMSGHLPRCEWAPEFAVLFVHCVLWSTRQLTNIDNVSQKTITAVGFFGGCFDNVLWFDRDWLVGRRVGSNLMVGWCYGDLLFVGGVGGGLRGI